MRNELLGILSPYKNNSVLINDYQQTDDIIKELLKGHKFYANEYDKISDRFWKGNVKKSCKYVWDFLKSNVRYRIEPDTRQSIKSPAAILATGTNGGYNDCKHYSSFFGGLLDSWKRKGKNINWCYRFANYKLFGSQPHHVFVVVNPETSNEVWCDAVLNSFDYHKPYVNKIDKKINTMALYRISGLDDIGCPGCGGNCENGFGDFGLPQISGRKERKAKRTAKKQARRYGENCKGRTGAKIAPPLILGRNAFLLLVKLNFRGLATKLDLALNTPNKINLLQKWCSFGGNAKTLKIAISQGKRKKRLGYIGVVTAASIAAAWASAQPIIIALIPIIAAAAKFLPAGSKGKEVLETASELGEQVTQSNENSGGATQAGFSNNWLYGGIALAGIYLLTKKSK